MSSKKLDIPKPSRFVVGRTGDIDEDANALALVADRTVPTIKATINELQCFNGAISLDMRPNDTPADERLDFSKFYTLQYHMI